MSTEIHTKAAPFIKWLKEAEEESSEDESEDDGVEIEYDDRARISSIQAQPQPSVKSEKNAQNDGEDDLDIDAI